MTAALWLDFFAQVRVSSWEKSSQLLNDNLPGAICKAPVLIRKELECLPGKYEIRLTDFSLQ